MSAAVQALRGTASAGRSVKKIQVLCRHRSVFGSDLNLCDIDEPTDLSGDRLRDTPLSAKDQHDLDEGPVPAANDRHGFDRNGLGGDRTENTDQERRVIVSEHSQRRSLDEIPMSTLSFSGITSDPTRDGPVPRPGGSSCGRASL